MDRIASQGIALSFNPEGGTIDDFVLQFPDGPLELRPLHRAPWLDADEELPPNIPLVERQLAGDFFCAPFGNQPGEPIHGWTANGTWQGEGVQTDDDGSVVARYGLRETVQGATVTKSFLLHPNHPFLYQSHRFDGGSGHLPIAHHAMICVPGSARLSFSSRAFAVTPKDALEPDPARGRSILSYPQPRTDLSAILGQGGESFDARTYPFHRDHEDIIVLAGERNATLAWTAALAADDGFLFFAIKDAKRLPETILWMSNGGRSYAPWNSRHHFVLGIEEAATGCHENGVFQSTGADSSDGLATGLTLGEGLVSEVKYGFGAIPAPDGWSEVSDIQLTASTLTLVDVSGAEIRLPFDGRHFGIND